MREVTYALTLHVTARVHTKDDDAAIAIAEARALRKAEAIVQRHGCEFKSVELVAVSDPLARYLPMQP